MTRHTNILLVKRLGFFLNDFLNKTPILAVNSFIWIFFGGGGVEIIFLKTVDKTSLNLLYYTQQEGLPNIAK